MGDLIIIAVTGCIDHDIKFNHFLLVKTKKGNVNIEFVNYINQKVDPLGEHEFTIVLNEYETRLEESTLYVDHINYRRPSVLQTIIKQLTGEEVEISKKCLEESNGTPFKYLDPILDVKKVKSVEVQTELYQKPSKPIFSYIVMTLLVVTIDFLFFKYLVDRYKPRECIN